MKKIFIVLTFLPFVGFCQNTIGLPHVINYSKQAYQGGLQNWDIKQDKNGLIYFANNEGLLCFDGNSWNIYPLPNRTIVRSIEIGPDDNIYVGGQDEFGYFKPAINGKLAYHSLTSLIPESNRTFGDVWDIVTLKKALFFRSNGKIFKFSDNKISTYATDNEWSFMGIANEQLLAHNFKTGLLTYRDNTWKPISQKNELPTNDPVTSILPYNKDSTIITTLKSGIFLLAGNTLSKLTLANNQQFANDRIYAATLLNQQLIALATNNNGVYIIDIKGNIIQQFTKKEGLQNNNVLSIYLDQQHNLWLGLDNGIDFIAYNSAIKQINPSEQNGAGYTAAIFKQQLYLGTTNGLFSVPLKQLSDFSYNKGNFEIVQNTKGQNWALSVINDHLLLAHHEGVFNITNNQAQQIAGETGYWNFVATSNVYPSPQVLAGNYQGLDILQYQNNQFTKGTKVAGFEESSRFVAVDALGNFWVSQPYHGVFKISPTANGNYKVSSYGQKDGLPSTLDNHVFKIKNEVVVATIKGVYLFDAATNSFKPSLYYQKIFGNQSLRYLKEDQAGNIWFIHEKSLSVADLSSSTPVIIPINELTNKILSGFEFIYPVNGQNILLGGEKGFFHINYEKYKASNPVLKAHIRFVQVTANKDSLLFGGYFANVNDVQEQRKDQIPSLSYNFKTVAFGYSSPVYDYQLAMEYSYQLEGYDERWSDWTKRTTKEYTNLPAGSYRFKVKARNSNGHESPAGEFRLKILPPWYQSKLALIVYSLILATTIYWFYLWQSKRFANQQAKYEEEQKKLQYIHDLEKTKASSDLLNLQNEKLESEINHKNSELASSAMHLVKKGELLSKIKTKLTLLQKELENARAKEEVKKIIRSLNQDEDIDKEWDNFTKHFDNVHSAFLAALKEKHPDITPNEHKLSAFLRMNLSSKEIAQLMNISVRGVEVARYRLRKKLNIDSDVNLSTYLLHIDGSSSLPD